MITMTRAINSNTNLLPIDIPKVHTQMRKSPREDKECRKETRRDRVKKLEKRKKKEEKKRKLIKKRN